VCVCGGGLKQQHGCLAEYVFAFLFDCDNKWTIEVRQVKFCVELDHKHMCRFYLLIHSLSGTEYYLKS
jgi:hypothetical protein